MKTFVLSRSPAFQRHVDAALGAGADLQHVESAKGASDFDSGDGAIVLVHAASLRDVLPRVLQRLARIDGLAIGVASDAPSLPEMLELTEFGIRAYFHSYMADVHYRQMSSLLRAGQSWFAPQLLGQALTLARHRLDAGAPGDLLSGLTAREREIAGDVASGLSNAEIAQSRGIKERTVKSHLTRIFAKLRIRSRTALAIKLKGRGATTA